MSIAQRLQHLEDELLEKRSYLTIFNLDDGSTFATADDPMTYLLKYGTKHKRGRIAGYEPTPGDKDPITAAVYAEIERQVLGEMPDDPELSGDEHGL